MLCLDLRGHVCVRARVCLDLRGHVCVRARMHVDLYTPRHIATLS